MDAHELAERHPRLYHVTTPGAWSSIKKLGLLTTKQIVELWEVDRRKAATVLRQRRAEEVLLKHPRLGRVVINDQLPLSMKSLEKCLEDGLAPADWLTILNRRVFFWSDAKGLESLLGAKRNRTRPREVLVADTRRLAEACLDRMEICPINSGSTFRAAARRGKRTFSPVAGLDYQLWQRQRGRRDKIREVTVRGGIQDPEEFIIEVLQSP